MPILLTPKAPGSFTIEEIDLSGITGVSLALGWREPAVSGYTFEIRLDDENGKVLGQLNLPGGGAKSSSDKPATTTINAKLDPVTDGKMHKLVITSKPVDPKEPNQVALQSLTFKL